MEGHRVVAVIAWARTNLVVIPYDVTRPLDISVNKLFKDLLGRNILLLAFQQTVIV